MNELPLVTIGAVNYNNSKYVIETLESIKAQSYENIELVIVDDCSTDDSITIIKEWLLNFKRPYKLIIHEVNRGVVAACNSALQNASGKYISTIATDDIMMPDKIQVQVSVLEESDDEVCAVYSDAHYIKEDGSPMYGLFIQRYRNFEDLPSGDLYEELLKGNFLPAMSLLVKMSHYREVGNFDEELHFEDYDMWLRLARKYKFLVSDYVSIKYRSRMSSLTHSIRSWYTSIIKVYLKHIDKSETARKQLREIAQSAYLYKDLEAIKVLKNANVHIPYVKGLLFMNKIPINRKVGMKVLQVLFK